MSSTRALPVVLPDCAALAPPEGLSPRQRRELVRLLAEDGPQALEAWLRKEEARDPRIRRRLAAERERLEREARAERRRAEDEHADESAAAASRWEKRMEQQAARDRALRERIAALQTTPLFSEADLHRLDLYEAVAAGPRARGLGRRILDALRALWILIVTLWVRFVRLLRGRHARPRTVLTLPAGVDLDLRHLGPDAIVAMRRRARREGWRARMKQAWDRLLGREDYAETVARMMAEEVARMEANERARRSAEEEDLRRRLEEEGRTDADLQREREREQKERAERLARRLEELARRSDGAYASLRAELLSDLEDQGLVDGEGRPTARLMDRFAKLLYEEARRTIPAGGVTQPGTYVEGEGEYEMGPMRSSHELGAMDLVSSLVHARVHHPHVRHIFDDDVRVHREVRTATAHIVLVFDTSGSMEQAGRLDAAKRVCMVLHRAVKDRNPDHRVDLLAMHTSIERVDLAGCWNAQPKGFTNHGAAMRESRRLFEEQGADTKVLYLVTDGLPEAMTLPDGTDKADRPDVCMQDALAEARRLRNVPGLRTVILQLETEDEMYVQAAADLAAAAAGRVEALDPSDLMEWMLGDVDTATRPELVA